MADLRILQDVITGEQFFPYTHESAVVDKNGTPVIDGIKNYLNQNENDLDNIENEVYTVNVVDFIQGYRHRDGVLKDDANYVISRYPFSFFAGDKVTSDGTVKYYFVKTDGEIIDSCDRATYTFSENVNAYIEVNKSSGITSASVDVLRNSKITNVLKTVSGLQNVCKNHFTAPCSINSAGRKLYDVEYTGEGTHTFCVSNKNLLPQLSKESKNGVTLTRNEDGTVTINGTTTDVTSFALTHNSVLPLTNGTFTMSLNNSGVINDELCFAEIQADDVVIVKCWFAETNSKVTFTLNETHFFNYFRIRIPSGITFNNFVLGLQIEEGTEATDFVKHEEYRTMLSALGTEHDCFEGYNYLCATEGLEVCGSYLPVIENEIDKVKKELEKSIAVLSEEADKKFRGKTIVCFGDSITGNYVTTDYPSIIAKMTGATVYNVGFGGCTMVYKGTEERREFSMVGLVNSIVSGDFSAQENSGVSITLANDDRRNYVPERIETLKGIDWNDVDYITIAYGTNDWNSNYMIDNESNPLDTTSYIGAFRYSIEKLLTAYPHIKILVLTPLWRWWDETAGGVPYRDSDNYAKGTGWYLFDYSKALIEACKEYHIPCLDLYYECMLNKFNRYVYFNTNDGTHPNATGRELVAGKISAKLSSTY